MRDARLGPATVQVVFKADAVRATERRHRNEVGALGRGKLQQARGCETGKQGNEDAMKQNELGKFKDETLKKTSRTKTNIGYLIDLKRKMATLQTFHTQNQRKSGNKQNNKRLETKDENETWQTLHANTSHTKPKETRKQKTLKNFR